MSIVDTAGSVLIHKAGNHTFTKFNGQGFPFVSQKDLLEIYVKNDAMQANLREENVEFFLTVKWLVTIFEVLHSRLAQPRGLNRSIALYCAPAHQIPPSQN